MDRQLSNYNIKGKTGVHLRKRKRFSFRPKPNYKYLLAIVVFAIVVFIAIPFTIRQVVVSNFRVDMYLPGDNVPENRVAIVFGAALTDYAQEPSAILEDRILTAVDLYNQGKVQKIIMSGDNRFEDYNEPQVMIDFAIDHGVRELDLQPDYAGRRTYDTCYRARQVFGLERATLITQEFHLPRALYLCNALGVDSVGVIADRRLYKGLDYFRLRDSLALTLAFWELYVIEPEVVLGDRINI
ncbi:MAG: vancomycin high temperature exclusion protein [Candidatus Dojkabacteria bacterium]